MDTEKLIPDRLYFRIGDVADITGVKPYVLRYWESEFPMITPEKSSTGQRVYRKTDVETVLLIKHLLYKERYSIEGARNRIRELKKQGGLKTFKTEAVAKKIEQDVTDQRRQKIQGVAQELRELLALPVSGFFR